MTDTITELSEDEFESQYLFRLPKLSLAITVIKMHSLSPEGIAEHEGEPARRVEGDLAG